MEEIAGLVGLGLTLAFTVGMILFSVAITVVSVAVPLGLVFLLLRASAASAALERELLATGLAAPGTIVSVEETGMYVNHRPQVRMVLEVVPPDGAPFTATILRVVS